ncbi:DUF4105 domain-containing protein [Caenorhabditis elegans]|uniref:DUF4105 domain-containing protein n=1 Tax=Caenorhabditis elegans TaxID=6239 RepID=O44923_CAEEL|nr:DUF4105 domain-containing protein [Caenorhabditis elegans]CCD73678.1 DUF4105 domain-containing protein [Caenorhabditis elegans]|eukprot:NP_494572.2 Uncharacterized protein CELE_W10G11.19 [Caenorhabditis elegans]
MRLFALIFSSFLCSLISAEHVTVTYHFWEKNEKIVEKVEWFTKFVANSNRFWTSNLVFQQHNEKIDRVQISSESWKSAVIEEPVTFPLDTFFVELFQKFADKLYTNLALDSLPIFDAGELKKSLKNFEIFEKDETEETFPFDFWMKIGENELKTRNRDRFVLFTRADSFEHWEAISHFLDALKRSKQIGYVVDCKNENSGCWAHGVDENPTLFSFKLDNFDDHLEARFRGKFQKDQVYDWILTTKQPEVKLLNEELVPSYRSGMVPGFDRARETVTILFIDTKKSQIWRNYAKFARENHGRFHLTALVSEEVKKWSIYPAFITMKPYDPFVKAFTLHKDLNWNRMVDYLEDGVHPGCHQLSSPSDFLFATGTQKPLVVFFDPLDSKNSEGFKKSAAEQQSGDRIAHFSAVTGFDLFGLYVMSVFNVNSPSYIVIRRQEKGWCIHTKPAENDNFTGILSWVRNLEPVHCQELIENFKFPIARLNLLERYDDVEELEKGFTAVEWTRDEL